MAPIKIKIVLTKETTDTKIQKRPRTRTCRKKNENSTTTLLEELAYESVSSSQPNTTGDSIMRSAMGKPFGTFRINLKQNDLEDFFRNSCFGHFLNLPENNNTRFQMTMVYELLKRRFIFQNPEKNDEDLINYYGMPLFFGRREFAIVSGLKCHPPSEPVPEFIVKKEPRRRKKGGKEETIQSTEEHDLMSLVGTSFKNPDLIYLLNVEDTPRKHKESLCLLWFVHNVLLATDLNNNISLKWAFNNYPWGHESFELTVKYLLKPLGPKTNNLFGFLWAFMVDGHGIDAGAGQDQGATSYRRCSGFLCEKCKNQDEDSIMYLQTLSQAVNEFKNKRGGGVKVIPSKNVRHPYTPQAKRRKKILYQGNTKFEEENLWRIANGRRRRVTIAEKNKLVDLARANDLRAEYGIHCFRGEDFRIMTSMDIWWEDWYVDEILSLMRERHVRYPEYYDFTDRILDLNFYSNFKLRYDEMSEAATTVGGRSFTQLINEFEWDKDMINCVRGIRPYPGGMDWIGAKRLLAVMDINKTHFVTLEILLYEGHMNVYDCLLIDMEHAKFLTFIQLVFELLPKLLKQSGIMKHLPDKFLNEPWEFKGRLEPMVTNNSKVACASYSLAFIEHLITKTTIQPPKILL
ncbi:hypothetical protein H5410_037097 [Solanum commersonii]|uniref:DUF1985 domain-containing protein n=1 Tax=Solanum commersonii TaxID=4109 RepID=A0A9J5Y657_SOLCO|nr:hypothetical protein H5410_037097 [Solanum commersonii]